MLCYILNQNYFSISLGESSYRTRRTVTTATCSKNSCKYCNLIIAQYSFCIVVPVNGALILSRNNVSSTSYYYGVVRVYYNGLGNICDDYLYDSTEANVICHQLGYTGASSYSRAGLVRFDIY